MSVTELTSVYRTHFSLPYSLQFTEITEGYRPRWLNLCGYLSQPHKSMLILAGRSGRVNMRHGENVPSVREHCLLHISCLSSFLTSFSAQLDIYILAWPMLTLHCLVAHSTNADGVSFKAVIVPSGPPYKARQSTRYVLHFLHCQFS